MIVGFFGHSIFSKSDEVEKIMLDVLEKNIGDAAVEFYFGGYGEFDFFAYQCCDKYRRLHSRVKLVFITPYVPKGKESLLYQKEKYDEIIYPPIEEKPLRFAIWYRNKYMVDKSDFLVFYVDHDWGGAYNVYKHAKKQGKKIYNLADFE